MAWLRAPLDDYLAALERVAAGPHLGGFARLGLALLLSWWVYVPAHELLHAYGCLWSGGDVSRLEIDAVYGAAWLQQLFPFVAVGSEYAGQLVGFDTHGNDLIYLATCWAPFVLTVVVGVPLLRAAAQMASPTGAAWALGAAIPPAFAPFLSLPGDFYEIGSIVVTHLADLAVPELDTSRWRSDDLFALIEKLAPTATAADLAIVVVAFVLGLILALTTYALGRRLAGIVVR